MPMRTLVAAVYVQHPASRETVLLLPGEAPVEELAELVTNPRAWVQDSSGVDGSPVPVPLPEDTSVPADNRGEEGASAAEGAVKKTGQRRSRASPSSDEG